MWVLVDPETEVATAPLATLPDPLSKQLPGVIRGRYLTPLNRWDTMQRPSSPSTVPLVDGETSRLHREVLDGCGIGDVASIVFRDRHGCWGFLDLWRSASDTPFSDSELNLLAEDVDEVTAALRRCQARAFDDQVAVSASAVPAVLFVSADLEVLGQTPETEAYLRALLPTDADRAPVPAGAFNVAAALLGAEAGLFDHPPIARTRPAGGTLLTFRAARIDDDRPAAGRDIAVTITASTQAERRSLYVRAHGLSRREIDVVELLAEGPTLGGSAGRCSCQSTRSRTTSSPSSTRPAPATGEHCWPASPATEPPGRPEPQEPGMGNATVISYVSAMPTLHIDHAISDLAAWRNAFDPLATSDARPAWFARSSANRSTTRTASLSTSTSTPRSTQGRSSSSSKRTSGLSRPTPSPWWDRPPPSSSTRSSPAIPATPTSQRRADGTRIMPRRRGVNRFECGGGEPLVTRDDGTRLLQRHDPRGDGQQIGQ